MKKTIYIFTLKCFTHLFSLFILQSVNSQTNLPNLIKQIIPGSSGMYPSVIQFNSAQGPAFINGQVVMVNEKGNLESIGNLKLVNSGKDQIEQWHYRYQQIYKGIPVENAIMAVYIKNGKIDRENGNFIKDFPARLSVNNIINKDDALKYALSVILAQKYAWQDESREQRIKNIKKDPTATNYPKAELVWYNGDREKLDTTLQLAYRLEVFAISPMSHNIIYIDAQNGKLLGKKSLINEIDVAGKANTVYSGERNIVADYDTNRKIYTLKDATRGIETYNMESKNIYREENFVDNDNSWFDQKDIAKGFPPLDQYGADAHWGAEMVFDYYSSKFNRIGLDGNGYPLISYVNANLIGLGAFTNSINAFWDGGEIILGMGGIMKNTNVTYTPFTSLITLGHEFTHGVTHFSSNLEGGNYESGALNEGFSDILGTLIEFENSLKANWIISDENTGGVVQPGGYYRDISNPKQFKMPDCYKGKFWDYKQEPHQNSTVLSHWFYLLSEGGTGTNDLGDDYKVTGIGKDKAGKIAYNTNIFHLNAISNYYEARRESIAFAETQFGKNSNEAIQTRNAWIAVGLGDPIKCKPSTTAVCPGSTISAQFESDAQFEKGNVFILYISDASGSFKNQKAIGWLGGLNSQGTINGIISSSFPAGNYKLRVESTNPALQFTINADITVLSNLLPYILATQTALCPPYQTAILIAPDAKTWKWNTGEITQGITIKLPGTYSVSVGYENGCQSPAAEIKISKPADCSSSVYRWWLSEQEQNNNTSIAYTTAIQVYPNPSKAISTINFTAKQSGPATLKVYNTFGKVIATLFNGIVEKGKQYSSTFNGSGLSGGMYLIKLQSGKEISTQKLLLKK